LSTDELHRLINAHRASQAIAVAAELGIDDLLADGGRTSDDLARETETDSQALYRLLRVLASIGVLREGDDRLFSLTELGDALRSDAPRSLRAWAAFSGQPSIRAAWAALADSDRTGANAFKLVHGVDVWEYRREHPDESDLFDQAMAGLSHGVIDSLLEAYDFGRFRTIVDVGGGNGALLRALLERYENLRGVLYDQPHVVEGVDLGPRGEVVGGSFFETVPEGADAYVLKWIIHDWLDEEALAILRTVRRAGGTLLVVERVLGGPNETPEAKLSDLNMLVAAGGMERTLEEFGALFAAAGYRLERAVPTASAMHVLEAAPAESSVEP